MRKAFRARREVELEDVERVRVESVRGSGERKLQETAESRCGGGGASEDQDFGLL